MFQKKILFVFAHPDDETFTSGATIAKYVREEETEITLLCATRGQAGKAGDPPICTPDELPNVREAELRKAAEILGIQHVELLEHQDKYLSAVPREELASQIIKSIKNTQPQIVITFAPHGISGHPDHVAISAATELAIHSLKPGEHTVKKFYFVTHQTPSDPAAYQPLHTDSEETITTRITAPGYVQLVGDALLAHRTQHLSVARVFPGLFNEETNTIWSTNAFILQWHNLPGYQIDGKESDLFAGIA